MRETDARLRDRIIDGRWDLCVVVARKLAARLNVLAVFEPIYTRADDLRDRTETLPIWMGAGSGIISSFFPSPFRSQIALPSG